MLPPFRREATLPGPSRPVVYSRSGIPAASTSLKHTKWRGGNGCTKPGLFSVTLGVSVVRYEWVSPREARSPRKKHNHPPDPLPIDTTLLIPGLLPRPPAHERGKDAASTVEPTSLPLPRR